MKQYPKVFAIEFTDRFCYVDPAGNLELLA